MCASSVCRLRFVGGTELSRRVSAEVETSQRRECESVRRSECMRAEGERIFHGFISAVFFRHSSVPPAAPGETVAVYLSRWDGVWDRTRGFCGSVSIPPVPSILARRSNRYFPREHVQLPFFTVAGPGVGSALACKFCPGAGYAVVPVSVLPPFECTVSIQKS